MKTTIKTALATLFFCGLTFVSFGQNDWTEQQNIIINTMNGLSETTAPDGKGADAYGHFLSEDFSRWTIGSTVTNNKEIWVEGVKSWFDDGWRVSERKQEIVEILMFDNYAHTRRIVSETYLGPSGETSTSKAALAEIWIFKDGNWLLLRVNVHPM
jgi:hypothetical protein